MKKEGHGKYINIQENLAKLGKKDKWLRAAEIVSLLPTSLEEETTQVQPRTNPSPF